MTTTGGLVFKNNESYREFGVGGGSGNIPIALPNGVEIDSQMNLSWSLNKESYVNYSREAFAVVEVVATAVAAVVCLVMYLDDVYPGMEGDNQIADVLGTYAYTNASKYIDIIREALKQYSSTPKPCLEN